MIMLCKYADLFIVDSPYGNVNRYFPTLFIRVLWHISRKKNAAEERRFRMRSYTFHPDPGDYGSDQRSKDAEHASGEAEEQRLFFVIGKRDTV